MAKWKRIGLVAVVVTVLGAATATPTILWQRQEAIRQDESVRQGLVLQFVQQYGTAVTLVDIQEPERLHVFIWEAPDADGVEFRHWTLLIDGLFVELGAVEILSDE